MASVKCPGVASAKLCNAELASISASLTTIFASRAAEGTLIVLFGLIKFVQLSECIGQAVVTHGQLADVACCDEALARLQIEIFGGILTTLPCGDIAEVLFDLPGRDMIRVPLKNGERTPSGLHRLSVRQAGRAR